jgi:hypothetical protein
MAKKSSFWSNFWGETGRNSGKWLSNKIFGSTGWATPKRHILSNHDASSFERISNLHSNSNLFNNETVKDWSDDSVEKIIEMANEVSFNSNEINDICLKLDNLLTGARTANKFIQTHKICYEIFATKINGGIMRLSRNNELELANYYQNELNKIKRSAQISKIAPWFIIIFGIFLLLFINYLMGNFEPS